MAKQKKQKKFNSVQLLARGNKYYCSGTFYSLFAEDRQEGEVKLMKKDLTFWGMLIILFIFWIAVSGTLHWQSLLLGAGASYFITYFNRELLIDSEERPIFSFRNIKRLGSVLGTFFLAVMKANIQVAALVLNPRLPIAPTMVSFKTDFKKTATRVALGNAITLTPGTLTIMCSEEEFVVHALTERNGQEVQEWEVIEKLKQLEASD